MNPYYIALWIMFFVACVGMYAAFRWGYEMACQHHLDMVGKGQISINAVPMPSPGRGRAKESKQ